MYMMLLKLGKFCVSNWAQYTESSLIACCCCWGAILFRFCLQPVTKYHGRGDIEYGVKWWNEWEGRGFGCLACKIQRGRITERALGCTNICQE